MALYCHNKQYIFRTMVLLNRLKNKTFNSFFLEDLKAIMLYAFERPAFKTFKEGMELICNNWRQTRFGEYKKFVKKVIIKLNRKEALESGLIYLTSPSRELFKKEFFYNKDNYFFELEFTRSIEKTKLNNYLDQLAVFDSILYCKFKPYLQQKKYDKVKIIIKNYYKNTPYPQFPPYNYKLRTRLTNEWVRTYLMARSHFKPRELGANYKEFLLDFYYRYKNNIVTKKDMKKELSTP